MSSHDRSTLPRAEEVGVVTAFVVVMAIALLLVTGLVFDGGRAIVAKRHAINVAEQAARAGAQAIDIVVFDGGRAIVAKRHAINVAEQAARAGAQAIDIASVRSGGPYRLNPGQARRATLAYLAAAGETGTVAVSRDATGDLVSVVVAFSVRSSLLTLAGLPVLRGSGQANARTCQGVIQEENC